MEVRHLHPCAQTKSALLAGALAASGAGAAGFSYIGAAPDPLQHCRGASEGAYPMGAADFPNDAMRAGPHLEPISGTGGPFMVPTTHSWAGERERSAPGMGIVDGYDLQERLLLELDDELREPLVLRSYSCDAPEIEGPMQIPVPCGPGLGCFESEICDGEKGPLDYGTLPDANPRQNVARFSYRFDSVIPTTITFGAANLFAGRWIASVLEIEIAFTPKPYGADDYPWFDIGTLEMGYTP